MSAVHALFLALAMVPGHSQEGKLPVPGAGAIHDAEKELSSILKAELSDQTPAGKSRLLDKLLKSAEDAANAPAMRYCMLHQAMLRLADAADISGAVNVAERITRLFDCPAEKLRDEAIQACRKAGRNPALAPRYAAELLVATDAYIKAEDFQNAERLAKEAAAVLKTSKRTGVPEWASDFYADVVQLNREKERLGRADEALKERADGVAHTEVGNYMYFVKKDYTAGALFLSKGTDPVLKELVNKEGAEGDPLGIAEAWWAASKKMTGLTRDRYEERAIAWERTAMSKAAGIQVDKVALTIQKRARRIGKPIDLLGFLNVDKDVLDGKWAFIDENKLETGANLSPNRLVVPVIPPSEYDLEVEVAKQEGANGLTLGLAAMGRQFAITFDGAKRTVQGIESIDGVGHADNETKRDQKVFGDNKVHKISCSVRSTGVVVKVDGQTTIDWKGSFERLSLPKPWVVPTKENMFLGTVAARLHITKFQLFPVTGRPVIARR